MTGERLTVGPPFFNRWMLPIGLMLLALTGIGPLLAWRKSTVRNLRDQFLVPVGAAVVTAGALAALGMRVWVSGLCFGSAPLWWGRSRRNSGAARVCAREQPARTSSRRSSDSSVVTGVATAVTSCTSASC